MDLIKDFRNFIKKESLIKKGDKLLLAVSGGPDSLSMLDLMDRIKKEFHLEILVFHLNHKFRKKAEKEAEFVKNFCESRNLKINIKDYDVPAYIKETGASPEEAARKIRLDLLIEEAQDFDIEKVVLGHNKNDLVETIFLNMFRGTGLKGLSGIDPVSFYQNKKLVHPLLTFSRKEIKEYCNYRSLNPRQDPTNKQDKYTRNKIRLNIIPYIKEEINPAVIEKMDQMASILREENSFIEKEADQAAEKVIIRKKPDQYNLSLEKLKNISRVLRRRIFRNLIYELKEIPIDLYYYHFKEIEKLIFNKASNKKLDLPGKIVLKKGYNKIIIKKGTFREKFPQYKYTLSIPGTLKLPQGKVVETDYVEKSENWKQIIKKPKVCLCDAEKIQFPVIVRNRRKGDKFQPLGMKGTKKVKDFFIDEKIKPFQREKIPLFVDNSGTIIWIGGYRLNEKFKITPDSNQLLKIVLR